MSFLFFDYDRSHASIGGEAGIERLLGLPPVRMTGGIDTFKTTVNRVYKPKKVDVEHPILGPTGDTETRIVANERGQEYGLQGICVDTVTRLADYELDATVEMMNDERRAEGEDALKNLTRSWWGQYGDRMTRLFRMLSKLDSVVVATAHESIDQDDIGRRFHSVNIKGSAASKAPEYFDVVGYLQVDGSGDDARRYIQTADSTAYPQAKDRKNILSEEINFVEEGELVQDTLARIVSTYREHGTDHPKILLVGPSGSGKTLLLSTLAPLVEPQTEPVTA